METRINKRLDLFSKDNKKVMAKFLSFMKARKRTTSTIYSIVKTLLRYEKYLNKDLVLAREKDIQSFLAHVKDQGRATAYIRYHFHYLNLFYKWLRENKMILYNPVARIQVSRERPSINICSEEKIKKIVKYIKSKKSNPEYVFLLSLILHWGLSSGQLAQAKVEIKNGKINILTNKRLGISPIRIEIPKEPEWYHGLQKRFYAWWKSEQKRKKSKSCQLIFPISNNHGHTISATQVLDRIKKATLLATGEKISVEVLRKTCGSLYVRKDDGSMLTRLGWSGQTAFNYTWVNKRRS